MSQLNLDELTIGINNKGALTFECSHMADRLLGRICESCGKSALEVLRRMMEEGSKL